MKHSRLPTAVNTALSPTAMPLQGPMPAGYAPPAGAVAPGAPPSWYVRHCGGFSLIETTVAAILVLALAAGTYAVLKPASASSQAKQLNANIDAMQAQMTASYRNMSDFSSINTLLAQPYCTQATYNHAQHCPVPEGLLGSQPWGQLSLAAVAATATQPLPGWSATLSPVPASLCAAVVGNEFDAWDKIAVNGATVTSKTDAISTCSQAPVSSIVFTTYGTHRETGVDNRADIHCALDWKTDPSCPQAGDYPAAPPSFTTPTPIAAPTPGPSPTPCSVMSITSPAGDVYCPTTPVPGYPPSAPPSAPPSTPTPPPPPPSAPPVCVAPAPQTQTVACPTGETSSVPPYSSDGITQQRDATCPYYYGNAVWGPWTTTSDTCTPSCVAPPPSPTPPSSRAFTCPSGEITTTSPYASSATQTAPMSPTTYSCSTPSGPYSTIPGTVNGPWSPSYACATACVAPPPVSNPPTSRATACPSGTVTPPGASSFTQTSPVSATTYSCAAPTGPYSTSPGVATGPWSPSTSAACAPKCVAPASHTNPPTSRTFTCPSGEITTTSPYASSATQTSPVSSTVYSCPAPTGPYSTSGGVATGPWSPAYSCAPRCVAPSPVATSRTTTSGGPFAANGPRCPMNNAGQAYEILHCTTATQAGTINYSCPAPTGPVSSSTTWGTKGAPYSGCSVYNACPPACGTVGHPPCF